jgi:lipoate-protein ligase A
MTNKYINNLSNPTLIGSNINDPFVNLAIENWVFKNWLKDKPILMLWQNKPSLVIGRAQNPWLECDLTSALKDKITIVRRQSGGGTVFHDQGNINFTFLMPNNLYDKKSHLNIIISALKKLGIDTSINDRNDIVTQIQGQSFKLSGSAYRETKHTSFHHGTLLIKSDLELLKRYLHHKQDKNIEAKGVPSVRSRVTSINAIDQTISIESIIKSIKQVFSESYYNANQNTYYFTQGHIEKNVSILDHALELQQWEWVYAKSLPFTYEIASRVNNTDCKINLEIKQGKIEDLQLSGITPDHIPNLFQFLNKQPCLRSNEIENLATENQLSEIELKLTKKLKKLFI